MMYTFVFTYIIITSLHAATLLLLDILWFDILNLTVESMLSGESLSAKSMVLDNYIQPPH